MKRMKLFNEDNLIALKKLPDNSIDSVVTDPPYGLSFMNKKWDYDVPTVDFWKEVFRVLKPGGHVLSFGGTRTYHRMVVNMEDAGFEIRDQIMWIYGSGFPKSHNIGKAVDKLNGVEREVVGEKEQTGAKFKNWSDDPEQTRWHNQGFNKLDGKTFDITKGSSEYEGWGTALKPANEPICLARKPLSEKSVAENVLKWKTGGINVDGCRVGTETIKTNMMNTKGGLYNLGNENRTENKPDDLIHEGRFPANIILECCCDEVIEGEKGEIINSGGSRDNCDVTHEWGFKEIVRTTYTDKGDIHTNTECPCYIMDQQSGESKSSKSNKLYVNDAEGRSVKNGASGFRDPNSTYSDKGGASRFFYQAKVSKAERNMGLDGFEEKQTRMKNIDGEKTNYQNENVAAKYQAIKSPAKNNHPTVKPINLLTYLCRLVTPPNGIVLDPFMGSGSTGIAAQLEGFRFVGMELDEDYFKIAEARIENFESYKKFIKEK